MKEEAPERNIEDILRDYVIEEVDTSRAAQQERINAVKEYTKRYEAKRSISGLIGWGDDPKKRQKDEPWDGCADVGIPIDAFTIEGLLPRFLKVCFGSKPIVWIKGNGQSDLEKAPIVQEALNYQLNRLIKIYRKMKLTYKSVVIEGDSFAKCVWEKSTRPFNVKHYYLKNPVDGEFFVDEAGNYMEVEKGFVPTDPIDQFGTIPIVDFEEKQEEKDVYDGPVIYSRTIKEIIVPKNADSPEIEDWDWICDTYTRTFDWFNRRKGEMKQGKFKNIDKLKEKMLEKTSEDNYHKQMRKPIGVYEWHGKFDINKDEKDEEIIAFVVPEYKIFLGWMLNPHPRRQFFHYQIIPMEGSPFGKGVPEFLIGLRDMIDAIFNQMIDRGSINNNPPIIVPESHESSFGRFGPGVTWKSDNPNAYRALELPKSEQMEFAKMEFLLGMVQKLFGVMDYAVGSSGGLAGNRTASGIMTVVGEGNIKFDDMIRALQDVNEDLYHFIVCLNSDNLDDNFVYRLTEKEENPFKSIDKSYWGGNFDFEAIGNSVNINRQIEQDRAMMNYKTVMDSAERNPAISEETMIDVTKNLLRSTDTKNVKIRTKEEIVQQKEQAQQQQQQILQAQEQAAQLDQQIKMKELELKEKELVLKEQEALGKQQIEIAKLQKEN